VPRYGHNPVIASVSFGAERPFLLKRNADESDKRTFMLGGGAVLIMGGACQAAWKHSLPERKATPGPRINLTFRHVIGQP
jgi:alkylated DNA repair dioxygenase AlkB